MLPEFIDPGVAERFHPRVEADFMVKVLVNGRAVLAKAKDVSMAGLLLECDLQLEIKRVTIAIPLPGHELVASAIIKRATDEGLALEFDQLDWDDMIALAKYLHPRLP